jgi:hypothetical protein
VSYLSLLCLVAAGVLGLLPGVDVRPALAAPVVNAANASVPAPTPTPSATPTDPGTGATDSPSDLTPPPIRAVILVDESGSLSDADVAREKDAAQILALANLSPTSQVAVYGFGSSGGSPAVDQACPLTDVGPAHQQDLVTCIGSLHRRTPAEGNDTDHVAALTQALSVLGGPDTDGQTKLVFLLTDGRLDVSNSPEYGPDAATRAITARTRLAERLAAANLAGVQIWPLGFGSALDSAALADFAAKGGRPTCSTAAPQPTSRVVTSSDDVAAALFAALGAATCAQTSDFQTRTLEGGSQTELSVSIPEISTDGVIAVLKGDPRVTVTYLDPNGHQVPRSGTSDGSVFTASQTTGTVETLRIQNPRPGPWTVRLSSAAGMANQRVGVAAMWQGVLRASIDVNPPVPAAGQQVTVTVGLVTRNGAISSPNVLRQLRFSAVMSGGTVPRTPVALADAGRDPDKVAADGQYTGRAAIPAGTTGVLDFVATIDGPGVVAGQTSLRVRIGAAPPVVSASVTVERGPVHPGGTLAGTVVVDNTDAKDHRLLLRLTDQDKGTFARLEQTAIDSPANGRAEHRIAIRFDDNTAAGPASGKIRLIDADSGAEYLAEPFGVTVTVPKGLASRLWWLWVLIPALLALIVFVLFRLRAARRETASVADVTVHLHRGGESLAPLRAPADAGDRFAFTIADAATADPTLRHASADAGPGAGVFVVRRSRDGVVQLTTPAGEVRDLDRRRPVPVGHGLGVTYDDTRDEDSYPGGDGDADAGGRWRGRGRGSEDDPWAGGGTGDDYGAGAGYGAGAYDDSYNYSDSGANGSAGAYGATGRGADGGDPDSRTAGGRSDRRSRRAGGGRFGRRGRAGDNGDADGSDWPSWPDDGRDAGGAQGGARGGGARGGGAQDDDRTRRLPPTNDDTARRPAPRVGPVRNDDLFD